MSSSATSVEKVHVARTPGVCGGKPCIAGTRIRVWDIAIHTLGGASPEEVIAMFPHLTLADIHAALAYFYDHREEVERLAAEDECLVEQIRRKTGLGPLEKLLEEERKLRS